MAWQWYEKGILMRTKTLLKHAPAKAALILAVVVTSISATIALAAAGVLDPTFDADGRVVTDIGGEDSIQAMVIQPDGKVVGAGSSDGNLALARYDSNGALDASFGINGIVITNIPGYTCTGRAVALQSDGKIVLGGHGHTSYSDDDHVLVRYNSDGSLDTSFDGDGIVVTSFDYSGITADVLNAIGIQTDGKILTVGHTWDTPDISVITLARYNSDGSLDTSFDGDGKLITWFTQSDNPVALAIQPDGKFIVAGGSDFLGGLNYKYKMTVIRFNSDGTFDTNFNGNGKVFIDVPSQYASIGTAVVLAPNGKIVVAGSVVEIGGYSGSMVVVRLNPNGSLDATFGGDGIVVTDFGGTHGHQGGTAAAIQLDGKVVAGGYSDPFGNIDMVLARYNIDGSLDISFSGDGKVITSIGTDDRLTAIALQADGKIVAAGSIDSDFSDSDFALARFDGGGLSFLSTASVDGWILESTEVSNTGGMMNASETTFILGDGLLDSQYRAILSFNTAALPDTAVITKAALKIRAFGTLVGNNDPFTWGQGLRVDVCKGAFGTNALQLTDFNFNSAANCSLLSGRFGKTPVNGWYSANLLSTAFDKVNIDGITQFRLRFYRDDNDDRFFDYWRFYSGNAPTASRPQLIIEYSVP